MKISQYSPAENSLCLCASGKVYSACCRSRVLMNKYFDYEEAYEYYNKKDFHKALKFFRYAITKYMVDHRTIANNSSLVKKVGLGKLVEIDISAMKHTVYMLGECLLKLGQFQEALSTFERARGLFAEDRWQRLITYSIINIKFDNDKEKNHLKEQFIVLFPVTEKDDSEIINLYFLLFADEISIIEKNKLNEKLKKEAKDSIEILHRQVSVALSLLSLGDEKSSIEMIEKAVSEIDEVDLLNNDLNVFIFARILSVLGDLKKSGSLKKKSLEHFISIENSQDLSLSGRYEVTKNIADCFYRLGKLEDALDYYYKSFNVNNNEFVKIYIAQVSVELQKKDAVNIIKNINKTKFSKENITDYVLIYTWIALHLKDNEMILECREMLKDLKGLDPLFNNQKLKYLESVTDYIISGYAEGKRNNLLEKLFSFLKASNKYIIIQPNLSGLGLNINTIIDDLQKKKSD